MGANTFSNANQKLWSALETFLRQEVGFDMVEAWQFLNRHERAVEETDLAVRWLPEALKKVGGSRELLDVTINIEEDGRVRYSLDQLTEIFGAKHIELPQGTCHRRYAHSRSVRCRPGELKLAGVLHTAKIINSRLLEQSRETDEVVD